MKTPLLFAMLAGATYIYFHNSPSTTPAGMPAVTRPGGNVSVPAVTIVAAPSSYDRWNPGLTCTDELEDGSECADRLEDRPKRADRLPAVCAERTCDMEPNRRVYDRFGGKRAWTGRVGTLSKIKITSLPR